MVKSYTYDAATGAVTRVTLTADGTSRTTRYEYDDYRLVKKQTGPTGETSLRTYDAWGNILTETAADGRTTTYVYDGFGRCVKATDAEGVSTLYKYLWAAADAGLCATPRYLDDYEQKNNKKTGEVSHLDYIFANRRPVALVRTVSGKKTCYGVRTDRLGSLTALYTSAGLVQRFSYDAWGNRRNPLTGSSLTATELADANRITSMGFTGHEHADEVALIHMNARLYDPRLGMFVSVDPKAEDYYEMYPYMYCGGNPLNAVDPTGEDYWQTSDPEEIQDFWNWYNGNADHMGTYEFFSAGWESITEEELRQQYGLRGNDALVFNELTGKLYASSVSYEDPDFVVSLVSVNALQNDYWSVIYEGYSNVSSVAGTLNTLGDLYIDPDGYHWRGKNRKLYSRKWGGNQHTGPRSKALRIGKVFRYVGYGFTGLDIGFEVLNLFMGGNDLQQRIERSSINIAIAIVSINAPIAGLLIGGYYYYVTWQYDEAVERYRAFAVGREE